MNFEIGLKCLSRYIIVGRVYLLSEKSSVLTHQEVNWFSSWFFYILISNSFVHLQPGDVTFGVFVLEAKVPGLAKADGSTDEIEEFLTGGLPSKAELKFRVHGRYANRKRLSRRLLSFKHFSIWFGVTVIFKTQFWRFRVMSTKFYMMKRQR